MKRLELWLEIAEYELAKQHWQDTTDDEQSWGDFIYEYLANRAAGKTYRDSEGDWH